MTAADDIRRLRDEEGRGAASIDWERLLTLNYRRYVPHGGVIIDVGAHNGMHSRRLRRYLRPDRLFLVEPIPELAAGLRREFGRRTGAVVIQVALSTEATTTTFVVDDTSPGESGLRNRAEKMGNAHQTREITVEVDRLDNWSIDGRVTFIKVDVEGGELDVLLGGSELIRRDRPIISIEFGTRTAEMFGHSVESLLDFVTRHDLAIVDLLGNVLHEAELREVLDTYYWDYLLVPTERLPHLDAARAAVRADARRAIETFNPTIERWKKRLRF